MRLLPTISTLAANLDCRGLWLAAFIMIVPWHATAQSGQHGDGHAEMHRQYKYWKAPNNADLPCCDNTDCRPTRAFMHDDGLWRAWNGSRWLAVPTDRLLPADLAGDGRSHLCEVETNIYCFTPGQPRG